MQTAESYEKMKGSEILKDLLSIKPQTYSKANKKYDITSNHGTLEELYHLLTEKYYTKTSDSPEEIQYEQHFINVSLDKSNEYMIEDFIKKLKAEKNKKKSRVEIRATITKQKPTKKVKAKSLIMTDEEYQELKQERIKKIRFLRKMPTTKGIGFYNPNYKSIDKKPIYPIITKPHQIHKRNKSTNEIIISNTTVPIPTNNLIVDQNNNEEVVIENIEPQIIINPSRNHNKNPSSFPKREHCINIKKEERKRNAFSSFSADIEMPTIDIKLNKNKSMTNLPSKPKLKPKPPKTRINFKKMIGRDINDPISFKQKLQPSINYNPNYASTESHIKGVHFKYETSIKDKKRIKIFRQLHNYHMTPDYSIFNIQEKT